jgi:hypothetical protein
MGRVYSVHGKVTITYNILDGKREGKRHFGILGHSLCGLVVRVPGC